jgi:hypothetical protein
MPTLETVGSTSQSLAQRLAKGRIPAPEALRYAMILADSLRKIHEAGQAHGAVAPAYIAITRTGLELLPALGSAGLVTPYTAPEVVQGKPADSRSDIFSFGTILYEMLTGRAAFQGDSPDAIAAAIMNSAPPPSGSPAVDRLVSSCIAKDPAARWSRVQKLLLELKLLSVAVRRTESPAQGRQQADAAIRDEMQQIESRLAGRVANCEQSLVAVNERLARMEQLLQTAIDQAARLEQAHESTRQDTAALRDTLSADLGRIQQTVQSNADHAGRLEQTIESARQDTTALRDTVTADLGRTQQTVQLTTERTARVEQAVESARQDTATLRATVSEDLGALDKTLKSHNASVESVKTAMAQTDDLVERVVEALESLQSVVLDHSDDRTLALT